MKLGDKSYWSIGLKQSIAALSLCAIFAQPFAASAQQMSAPVVQKSKVNSANAKSLTEEQKILHILNRLGYGARPGDVEKVRQIGVEKYIEQQLNAANIDDAVADSKTQNLDVLKMSNAELFMKYPSQAGVLLIVAQRNGVSVKNLRGDMKEQKMIAKAEKNGAAAAMENGAAANGKVNNEAAMQNDAMNANQNVLPNNPAGLGEAERREYAKQAAELYREYGFGRPQQITQQLNASRILRGVYSERQLNEQMVDFWSNHFNVYSGKASTRWFLPEYDRDVIRPFAMGNFRDLLVATAKSPAMLFYLDNYQSVAPQQNNNRQAQRLQRMMETGQVPERAKERLRQRFPNLNDQQIEERLKQQMQNGGQRNRRGINENYARELMELHTMGVDGGQTQKDVQEVARAFTGWTIVDARGYRDLAAKTLDAENVAKTVRATRGLMQLAGLPADAKSGTFYFNERAHDADEKTVLGEKIKSGGGMDDGLKVIDILMKQPATAKFIARKLAVKFVSDNPGEALVNRTADAFLKSNGDIKTVLKSIFTSPEFFAAENYRAKIKTPFEVVVSSIRTLGADTNASPQLQGMLAKMGEPLYGYIAPTGYPDTAEDWVNTGALLERLNFGLALAANRIPGTKIDLTKFTGRDPQEKSTDDKEKVMNTFLNVVLRGEVSPATKTTLAKQLNQPLPEPKPTTANISADDADTDGEAMENMQMRRNGIGAGKKRNGANQANRLLPPSGNQEIVKIVGLILGSPEFQRQ